MTDMTTRTQLSDASWIEHVPGWLDNADDLMPQLINELRFERRRNSYGPEPRLTARAGHSMSPESLYREPNPFVEWPPLLRNIRDQVAETVRAWNPWWNPSGCIANLYTDGQDSIAYHADGEPALGKHPLVASVSFGATRTFLVRKSDASRRGPGQRAHRFVLASGDLLVMGGACQAEYAHAIGKVQKSDPRLAVTLRDYDNWFANTATHR